MTDRPATETSRPPVLSVRDLHTEFRTHEGIVHAVNGVSFDIYPGETVGIVGESGSGKSVSVMSMMGLLPRTSARITSGIAEFDGVDLLSLSRRRLRRIRGKDIGMVFQDPMSSLNPVFTVGSQVIEAIREHQDVGRREARHQAVRLLELVGVPSADARVDQYPHEYSGGMRQRAMIAMAIANEPRLLIADEPTTALDVTIQAQVMEALASAQRETGAATILITHDLGLIAESADRVLVMYAGRVVESGSVEDIFHRPRHPYTLGLLSSRPLLEHDLRRLVPISGTPPSLDRPPAGCSFRPRCVLWRGRERCADEVPPLLPTEGSESHRTACHFHDEMPDEIARVERQTGSTIGGRA